MKHTKKPQKEEAEICGNYKEPSGHNHPFTPFHFGCDHCSLCGGLRSKTELDHYWKCYIHNIYGNGEFGCGKDHEIMK